MLLVHATAQGPRGATIFSVPAPDLAGSPAKSRTNSYRTRTQFCGNLPLLPSCLTAVRPSLLWEASGAPWVRSRAARDLVQSLACLVPSCPRVWHLGVRKCTSNEQKPPLRGRGAQARASGSPCYELLSSIYRTADVPPAILHPSGALRLSVLPAAFVELAESAADMAAPSCTWDTRRATGPKTTFWSELHGPAAHRPVMATVAEDSRLVSRLRPHSEIRWGCIWSGHFGSVVSGAGETCTPGGIKNCSEHQLGGAPESPWHLVTGAKPYLGSWPNSRRARQHQLRPHGSAPSPGGGRGRGGGGRAVCCA